MRTAPTVSPIRREPELPGRTVVVIGGSAGIGFETARRERNEKARREIETIVCEHKERPGKEICNAILDYALKQDEGLRQTGEQVRSTTRPRSSSNITSFVSIGPKAQKD